MFVFAKLERPSVRFGNKPLNLVKKCAPGPTRLGLPVFELLTHRRRIRGSVSPPFSDSVFLASSEKSRQSYRI